MRLSVVFEWMFDVAGSFGAVRIILFECMRMQGGGYSVSKEIAGARRALILMHLY